MDDTERLLRKADTMLADLFNGGIMQPEQSDRFVLKMMEDSPFLRAIRYVPMSRPSMFINKLDLASRVLRIANQGAISSPNNGDFGERALARNDRTKVTTSRVGMNTFEVIAEVNLPFEVLEDNIEGGAIDNTTFETTVLNRLAEHIRIDLEDLCINGNVASADPYLSIRDGVLRKSVSNVVNSSAGPFDAVLVKTMLDTVPVRYKRMIPSLRMYVSHSRMNDYMLQVAMRQTNLGDAVVVGGNDGAGQGRGLGPFSPLGVTTIAVPQMPNDQAILLDPRNFIMGIQRQMRIDYDKDIRERVLIIVVTMRIDIQVEEEEQIVRAFNIGTYSPPSP
jgi:hypothetical protein